MQEVILDTIKDTLNLFPFLFITYLVMEWVEHKTSFASGKVMRKAGRLGPLFGSILGIVPQCGFSGAGSTLYAARAITLGTLFSIYLSTSDEMLPLMISEKAPVEQMVGILLLKMAIGMAVGFTIDFLHRRTLKSHGMEEEHMHHHGDHCCSGNHLVWSALVHTLQVLFFVLLVTFVLNTILFIGGEDALRHIMLQHHILGALTSALIGLIPNCAASVLLTQLFLDGFLDYGSLIGGLLTGAGIGLLVLFKVNQNTRTNLKILGLLYGIGAGFGMIINTVHLLLGLS